MPSNPPSQRPRKTWSFKSEVKGPSKTWSFTNDLVLLNLWTCRERMPRHRGSSRKNTYYKAGDSEAYSGSSSALKVMYSKAL